MSIKHLLFLFCTLISSANILGQPLGIGHTSTAFFDNSRNRNIAAEIYYPATSSGEDVPIATGAFPVIVFGHGFLIDWDAYQKYWEELVPDGYVICFPTTESGIAPNHENFGLDLRFLAKQMQNENGDNSSLFFNAFSPKTGLMGHSMGGGASFLAAENNSEVHTLVNFAAAETTPSAISAAANIAIPALLFSGDDDCVAPPNEHQDLMYASLTSECKTQISIVNGGHCYFAGNNFNCNLGETFCNPSLDINRAEQQDITFDFLKLWLDYSLKADQNAFVEFDDSLGSSPRINFTQDCNITHVEAQGKTGGISLFPNPATDQINLVVPLENAAGSLAIFNAVGQNVLTQAITRPNTQLNLSTLPEGVYLLNYSGNSFQFSQRFLRKK